MHWSLHLTVPASRRSSLSVQHRLENVFWIRCFGIGQDIIIFYNLIDFLSNETKTVDLFTIISLRSILGVFCCMAMTTLQDLSMFVAIARAIVSAEWFCKMSVCFCCLLLAWFHSKRSVIVSLWHLRRITWLSFLVCLHPPCHLLSAAAQAACNSRPAGGNHRQVADNFSWKSFLRSARFKCIHQSVIVLSDSLRRFPLCFSCIEAPSRKLLLTIVILGFSIILRHW